MMVMMMLGLVMIMIIMMRPVQLELFGQFMLIEGGNGLLNGTH